MLAVVTGATGFIGSHLVGSLLAAGHQVRCLTRTRSNLRWLPQDKVQLCPTDLLSGEGLEPALAGADWVFHLAGATKARDHQAYQRHNVEATRRLLAGVRQWVPSLKRFVFMSSQAAVGPSPSAHPINEDHACGPITPYGASKRDAEQVVRAMQGPPWVILRAVSVYGPRDRDFLTLVSSIQSGWAPLIGSRHKTLTFVHVDDVVQALRLAAERPQAVGQTYFITDGHSYTWAETRAAIEQAVGRKSREVHVPLPLVWTLAAFADGWSRLTGRPSILSLSRVREFTQDHWGCSSQRLQDDLGFVPAWPLALGLEQTVTWAREHRWL